MKQSRAAAAARGVQSPDFFDAQGAVRTSKTWKGEDLPRLFKDALAKGIRLVSHELFKANEPGLVKSNALAFATVRADVHFDGKIIPTNVGVRTRTLVDRLRGKSKGLVSADARAVLIFAHGGGTTTTGHHVAIQMAAYLEKFGIDVISFDQLWHAEGPRHPFKNSKEYFEYVRSFMREHVEPAGVPIFFGGHSMGGLFADLYMRHYPEDDLVKGVLALSPVPDMVPGGSLQEKLEGLQRLDSIPPEMLQYLAESDAGVGDALLKQGKLTPLAEIFEGEYMLQNNWAVPDHQGRKYLPALFVWGSGDWLYVGKEKLVNDYIRPLSNVTLKIYGERVSVTDVSVAVKNKTEPVQGRIGHLIFDHFPSSVRTVAEAKESNLEAYQDIKQFIEKTLGIQLQRHELPAGEQFEDQFLLTFLSSYVNNLAFREYLRTATFQAKTAPDDAKAVQGLAYEGRRLKGLLEKARAKSAASSSKVQEDIVRMEAQLEEVQTEIFQRTGTMDIDEIIARFALEWAPAGPEGDVGRVWIAEKKQLYVESRELDTQIKKYRKELESKRQGWHKALSAFQEKLRLYYEAERTPGYEQAVVDSERAFQKLSDAYAKVYARIVEYRSAAYRKGRAAPPEVPPSVKPALHQYKRALDEHMRLEARLPEVMEQEARSGAAGAELQVMAAEADRLQAVYENHRRELEGLEGQYAQVGMQIRALEKAIIEKYEDKFLVFRSIRASDVLAMPFSEYDSVAQYYMLQFWAEWKTIYKDRPESTGPTSLY